MVERHCQARREKMDESRTGPKVVACLGSSYPPVGEYGLIR